MFGAPKRGRFRSLASLILVVNVVGELQRKRTLAASRGFLAAARLSCIHMTFNSHNIVSGQSGPFVLINVCMHVHHPTYYTLFVNTSSVRLRVRATRMKIRAFLFVTQVCDS